jgi:hypothetical protein
MLMSGKAKLLSLLAVVLGVLMSEARSLAAVIWIEGENATKADVHRHPWWYDKVKKDELSGGDFISNWNDKKAGELEYTFQAPTAGDYEFWVRANPVGTKLSYKLNDGAWIPIDLAKSQDSVNIAEDGKIDLRFLAWDRADQVKLKKGENTIQFRMDSQNNNHGMLDCFVLSTEPFQPRGILKPAQIAEQAKEESQGQGEWFAFAPGADPFTADSAIDLRSLNEKTAGDDGFIAVKDGEFVHGKTGAPVRFWAVNGPPDAMKDPKDLRACARILAKHGVNLMRIHAPYFNESGDIDPARVQHAIDIVEAMQAEGIYCDFSVFWYSFISPKPNTPWLQGFDGSKHPFAALYFNPDFQKQYQSWWKALLTTPGEHSGKRLIDDPAVACLEMCNEDSYFFWTFSDNNIPDAQLRIVEKQFYDWLVKKYGSIDSAMEKWHGLKTHRDAPAEGRMGMRPLFNMFRERTDRDKDTATFLVESQRGFYGQTYQFLRDLGFKGVMTGSNWTTASPEYLGPLDKYSYTVCDYVDRHGYFGCGRKGQNDGWAVMNDQTYFDRSALRFDPEKPGKPKDFNNPVMDPHYDGKPSMISETTFERPNRYRSEAPLYYACYGALQGSNGIVHFAMDTDRWTVKPGYFMQPWTVMTPAMMGQFPAAALIFRQRLVSPGDQLVELNLKISDLEDLKGTPMPQDASFDVLRAKDVPQGTTLEPGKVIDPLVHYAGRTDVKFTAEGGPSTLRDLKPYVDRERQTVTSTTGQLKLDYGKGTLTINAPAAQGVSGNLKDAGAVQLHDLSVESDLLLGHIVAVSLDGKPLASSEKILLQVMSEEQNDGWKTRTVSGAVKKITGIGHDPWMVRQLQGVVKFTRPDAMRLKVAALDFNGYLQKSAGSASEIKLQPNITYYLITP